MSYSERDVELMKQAWEMRQSSEGASQVGAVVANPEGEVIGRGRSQMPQDIGYVDGAEYLEYVIHAEEIAIGNRDVRGCLIYATRFPCVKCAKLIRDKGISRVFYSEENLNDPGHSIEDISVRIPNSAFL